MGRFVELAEGVCSVTAEFPRKPGLAAGWDSGTGGLEAQTEISSRQRAARARLRFHGSRAAVLRWEEGRSSSGGRCWDVGGAEVLHFLAFSGGCRRAFLWPAGGRARVGGWTSLGGEGMLPGGQWSLGLCAVQQGSEGEGPLGRRQEAQPLHNTGLSFAQKPQKFHAAAESPG